MKNKIITILSAFILGLHFLHASDGIPERPYPPRLVNDFSGILNAGEINTLEADLVAFDDSTGVQITIVTVNDFGNYTRAEFADILGERWGVGRKKLNNGVVILIKPTGGENEREVHIAVGYGLEEVLPDAICKRIVEVEMIPEFRNRNFYAGINKGLIIIKELAIGLYPPDEYKKRTEPGLLAGLLPFIVIVIIVIVLAAGSRNSNTSIGTRGALFWTLLSLMSSRGGYGGGGGGYSSGGGGFGGFGGGSFGGGGAGGSW